MKLQHDANGQFKLTLPKPLVLAKRWSKGDEIVIELNDRGDLVLRRRE